MGRSKSIADPIHTSWKCSVRRNLGNWFSYFVIFTSLKLTFIGLNRCLDTPFQFLCFVCANGSPEGVRGRSAIRVKPCLESAVFARRYFRCHKLRGRALTFWFKSNPAVIYRTISNFAQTLIHVDVRPSPLSPRSNSNSCWRTLLQSPWWSRTIGQLSTLPFVYDLDDQFSCCGFVVKYWQLVSYVSHFTMDVSLQFQSSLVFADAEVVFKQIHSHSSHQGS